jgi:hypothetical protein
MSVIDKNAVRGFVSSHSSAPSGLGDLLIFDPRLAPWAVFFRRFAAG